jgi:hypothetical protein
MPRPLLPLPDYQRIYQVAYSVLQATEIAITHRACLFFASAGAALLRKHYQLPATISTGCLALMVDEAKANVLVYGREVDGEWICDAKAFHAWVECEGWLIDFMAPIMGISAQEDGAGFAVPRRMLQKRLEDCYPSPLDLQHAGDFFRNHDPSLGNALIDSQKAAFTDLLHVCDVWFRRPPRQMPPMGLGDSHGKPKMLRLQAPSIEGVW